MAKKQVKTKNPRRQIKVASVFLAIALVITVVQCGRQLARLSDLNEERDKLQVAYEQKLTEQEQLKENKALLQDDTYLERLAKERFKLVKPNEYLVVPAKENADVADYEDGDSTDIH